MVASLLDLNLASAATHTVSRASSVLCLIIKFRCYQRGYRENRFISVQYGGMEKITQVKAGRLDLKEQLEIPVKKIR